MDTRRVLIADGTEAFRTALADELIGSFQVQTCSDGKQALEAIRSFCPDVLVIDLMIPGLDGISLLQTAKNSGMRAQVLATTRYLSDYVAESLGKIGVGYLMVKPCDICATVERIRDMAEQTPVPEPPAQNQRAKVSRVLFALGIPTKLRGHACLREAILSMAQNPGQSITKELYPEVAILCNGTPTQVERSIRGAITAAWNKREEKQWRYYFAAGTDVPMTKPTNADFITRLADMLLSPENEV